MGRRRPRAARGEGGPFFSLPMEAAALPSSRSRRAHALLTTTLSPHPQARSVLVRAELTLTPPPYALVRKREVEREREGE